MTRDEDDAARPNRRLPRFNHVALSLPADALDARGRSEIIGFWGGVFGWEELPTMTEDRRRLVLAAHRYDQFVFLHAEDEPMVCAPRDHFGMAVADLEDLMDLLERTRAYAHSDERVEIVDYAVDDQEVVRIHSFYVRYLLPLMMEVQYFEWAR